MKTLRELCLAPENADAFSPDRLARIEETLQAGHGADMPWYLRVIVGIGAWLSSLFFLGSALALLGWDHPEKSGIGVMGLMLLVAAVFVGRQKWGVFAEQAALAVSLAAQGMIYIGFVGDNAHTIDIATPLSIALAAILYVAFPSFLSRLITCFAALQTTLLWIQEETLVNRIAHIAHSPEAASPLFLVWWAAHLAVLCWIFLRPRRGITLAPLGYALIISLAAWQVEELCRVWIIQDISDFTLALVIMLGFWLRVVLLGAALLLVAAWAAGGRAVVRDHLGAFLGLVAGVVALAWLGLGGVLLALLFVLLGFALQDRPVLGLGLILLPAFLAHYYYSLELDLLQKSGVLVASGLVLLALRAGVINRVFAGTKETEAA